MVTVVEGGDGWNCACGVVGCVCSECVRTWVVELGDGQLLTVWALQFTVSWRWARLLKWTWVGWSPVDVDGAVGWIGDMLLAQAGSDGRRGLSGHRGGAEARHPRERNRCYGEQAAIEMGSDQVEAINPGVPVSDAILTHTTSAIG